MRNGIKAITLVANTQNAMNHKTIETSEKVNATAKSVWMLVSAFDKLDELIPQIFKSSQTEGNGVGAIRTVDLNDGHEPIVEELTAFDEENMTFSYRLLGGELQVENYTAHLQVIPEDSESCTLTWVSNFDVDSSFEESAMQVVKGMQKLLFKNLKGQITEVA